MVVKEKKCKNCDGLFTPYRTTDNCCSPLCFYEYNKEKLKKVVRTFKSELNKNRKKPIKSRSEKIGLIRNVDQIWSKVVRLKYKNRCALCQLKSTSAHHIFPKGAFPHMRYVIENGIGLCDGHHTKGDFSAHLNPIYFKSRVKQIIGEENYDKLSVQAHDGNKIGVDLDQVYLELKQVYKDMLLVHNKEV